MTSRSARLAVLSVAFAAGALVYAAPASAEQASASEEQTAASEDESVPVPAAQVDLPPPSARWNVAVTGLGITAAWYGAALVPSFAWQTGPWAPKLRIPIVGPWMALPEFKCGTHHYACGAPLVAVRGVLAGLDGVGQIGGLAIALESLFLPVRRSDHAGHLEAPHAWVRPVPFFAGKDTIGVGFVGEL
jgi:hypothetical protein